MAEKIKLFFKSNQIDPLKYNCKKFNELFNVYSKQKHGVEIQTYAHKLIIVVWLQKCFNVIHSINPKLQHHQILQKFGTHNKNVHLIFVQPFILQLFISISSPKFFLMKWSHIKSCHRHSHLASSNSKYMFISQKMWKKNRSIKISTCKWDDIFFFNVNKPSN